MKAVIATFNQEKALVGAFSVIVQPVVEPMEHYTALPVSPCVRWCSSVPGVTSSPATSPATSSVTAAVTRARVTHQLQVTVTLFSSSHRIFSSTCR